ncbi:hypothetical protein N9N97_03135 [Rickettsiaceae bacterium]|nr:hypothetical protein [Rickettsiaceae bacterium]
MNEITEMTKSNMKSHYTAEEIAVALDLTERRIQQLAKEGILPKVEKGKYNLAECIRAYDLYVQDSSKPATPKDSKSRWLDAKAEKAELELKVFKGGLITTGEVKNAWTDLFITFRTRMLNIPTKLTPRIAACNSDLPTIENMLQSEIEDALTELSKYKPEEDSQEQQNQLD